MVTRPGTLQASFNSGEIAPELWQRNDVKQFYAAASYMRNVDPVPQGGFRVRDGTRDLGPQRSEVAGLPGTPTLATNLTLAAAGVIASHDFGGAWPLAGIVFAISASHAIEDAIAAQYQDPADGVWKDMPTPHYRVRPVFATRVAGLPPESPTMALGVRLYFTGALAPATFTVPFFAGLFETGVPHDVQYVPFTVSRSQAYMLVLSRGAHADVYQDGQWIASAWHGLAAGRELEAVPLQRLETLLLFHQEQEQVRIMRGNANHEWASIAPPWSEIPDVDLGGDYVKVTERWELTIRWPSSSSPAGYGLVVSVDGEETTVVFVTGVLADLGPAVQTALEALPTVDPGVACYLTSSAGASAFYSIDFAGDGNAGSQFTVSARFVNTAEGGAATIRVIRGDPGGEPLFSSSRGYPACGLFYQDRLVQAGFRSKPGAMLASPSADYFNGNVEIEAATGGILMNVDTDGAETIQRLARSKHLVIFTSDAEYFIFDRAVRRDQPTNIVESSRNGSCPTVPIVSTENGLLYVTPTRSLVYNAVYDDVAQAYVSEPLSLLAKHLTREIRGAALQRANDDSDAARYFLVRDDGTMAIGHIIKSQEVTAFVRWQTAGAVKAVGVDGRNRTYLSVERLVGGVLRRRIEWVEPGLRVDGAVSVSNPAPQAYVGGLAMHEGAVVWAIADGFSLGPFTVADGGITLPCAVAEVTVGRWTPPRVVTLPAPREVGPRIVNERPGRIFGLILKLLETTSIAVGANDEPPEDVTLYRSGMPTDLPQIPVTGFREIEGLEGWTLEPRAEITQMRPGELQIAALVVQARL